MRQFLKKHKEKLTLLGLGLAFVLFIGLGLYLQKQPKTVKEPMAPEAPASVKLAHPKSQEKQGAKEPAASAGSYFLKPSPDELLAQLASMKNLNSDVIEAKFTNLPVLWPAYFFALRKEEDGRTKVILDVSEDGFGVMLQSEVEAAVQPSLTGLSRGEKVWIGGKIVAVDPAGTGTIYLKMEQLTVGAEPPYSPAVEKPPQ